MSNGIGKNPLTDISKVYLQQVANESAVPGKPAERLKTDRDMFNIPKSEQDAAKKRVQDKTKKKQMEKGISSAGYTKEGMDPVNPVAVKKKFANRKDRDLDNDGDTDSSDKYLHKRRKAIAGAMKKRMSEGIRDMDPEKGTAERKARLEKKRGMKMDDHPQYKKMEEASDPRDEASMKVFQKLQKNVDQKKKKMKESFSSWRTDLSEIMTDDIDSKPVKEKKINNKIKINPKLGEAVEELGGEILEVTEVDEAVYGGTPAKKEAPKDNRMVVTAADKKGNTPAYQRMKAGDKRYKAADHMKESSFKKVQEKLNLKKTQWGA
jgi:hypothetical protein